MFHMPMITKSRSPTGTEGRVVLMCGVVGVEGGSKGRDAAVEIVKRNEAYLCTFTQISLFHSPRQHLLV